MEQLNTLIADNLRGIREERKLSLDNVAKLTGVSKSMLGQIERAEVNPTVATLWKISKGLKISFTQLMDRPEADIELVIKSDIQPLVEDGGKFRNYPVFPFDTTRRFEMYTLDIEEGSHLEAEAHPQGTHEFISVFSGELTLDINGDKYTIAAGNSIRFKADVPHGYLNSGNEICYVSMVIYYQ